jgi:hypothetical protein
MTTKVTALQLDNDGFTETEFVTNGHSRIGAYLATDEELSIGVIIGANEGGDLKGASFSIAEAKELHAILGRLIVAADG